MDLILRTHLGAGDGIIQTGMAVALLDKIEGDLWFPCYPQYEATFQSIFMAHPRIRVFTIEQRPGENWGSPTDLTYEAAQTRYGITGTVLRCGVYNGQGCWEDFSKHFYHDAGIEYAARWSRCPIREAAKNFKPDPADAIDSQWPTDKYRVFIHDDARRGFRIRKLVNNSARHHVFRPSPDKVNVSMLTYVPLIESAEEIHCIDSAFFHLVDSLEPTGRLYLHKYPRWPRRSSFRFENRLSWEYVE